MRAVALLRCSTGGQDLDHQRKAAHAWAGAHGYAVEIVEEQGVSGAAKKRPGLDKVMGLARKHKIAAVWCRELSRLGRSLVGVVACLEELSGLGVRVVVANAGIDYGTAAGRLQAQIVAAFSEFEREMAKERSMSGVEAARARCEAKGERFRVGRQPFEWSQDDDARLRWLRESGLSYDKIAERYAENKQWHVFRAVKTADGWTSKPFCPGRRAVRDRLRELQASSGSPA